MEDKILAAALQDRAACNRLQKLVQDKDFTDIGAELFKQITSYYEEDDRAESVDIDLFKLIIEEHFPKQADIINSKLEQISTTSVPNLLKEVTRLKKKALSQEIIQVLARNPESVECVSLMDQFQEIEDTHEEEIQSAAVGAKEVLSDLREQKNLIPIFPSVINDVLEGGLMRGSHVVIMARPNIGKTLTVVNMASSQANKGFRVLHLMNEEPKKQLLVRYISRLSGKPKREILLDIDSAVELAEKRGLSNVFIEDINPGTFHEIRGLIEQIKPDVVYIDQLRNISVKDDSKVGQLEKAATEARNLAKKYDVLVVSVTQAGDSAEGKAVLTQSDIDSSKTGIPGQADLILGVGATEDQKRNHLRTLTIVKNKVNSTHDFYAVRVQEDLSKIESN